LLQYLVTVLCASVDFAYTRTGRIVLPACIDKVARYNSQTMDNLQPIVLYINIDHFNQYANYDLVKFEHCANSY